MRFMMMHKMTDEMEKGVPPTQAVMEGIGKLIEEANREKVFVSGEGLKPSSQRVQLVYKNGKRTVTNGPFADPRELIAGFALMRVRSKEEAVSWLDKFADAIGDVEISLGPIVEPWDFGAPKPADPPLRFLATHKADARAESEAPPDARFIAKMGALTEAMKKAGVLEATGALLSTKRGARIRFEGGKRTIIDGPFAESKELIAGYAIFDLPSKAEALDWAIRFGEVVDVNEVELRQMAEM